MTGTDVKTIADREEALVLLLAGALPGWHVTGALDPRERAARAGISRLPEARLLLLQGAPARPLLWKLELTQGDPAGGGRRRLGPWGIFPTIEALGAALAGAGRCLRMTHVRERGATALGNTWEILLEEAWTPSGEVAQAVYLPAEIVGVLAEEAPAGSSAFALAAPPSIPEGSHVAAVVGAEVVSLGRVTGVNAGLTTSLATPLALGEETAIVALEHLYTFPEAAGETRGVEPGLWRHLDTALDGTPHTAPFGAEREEVGLHLYPCPETVATGIRASLGGHPAQAFVLLRLRNQMLVSASMSAMSWSVEGGLQCTFAVHSGHQIQWEESQ